MITPTALLVTDATPALLAWSVILVLLVPLFRRKQPLFCTPVGSGV